MEFGDVVVGRNLNLQIKDVTRLRTGMYSNNTATLMEDRISGYVQKQALLGREHKIRSTLDLKSVPRLFIKGRIG